ncbi:MAG: hypothetical protein OEM29_04935 [Thermoplasmata archaeon]|nr:hypothetical protein [Thermoplasmata archaeon]
MTTEDSVNHGQHITRVRVYHEIVDDGIEVVFKGNGAGIPSKEKELVFEQRFGKGTGYGLYLT